MRDRLPIIVLLLLLVTAVAHAQEFDIFQEDGTGGTLEDLSPIPTSSQSVSSPSSRPSSAQATSSQRSRSFYRNGQPVTPNIPPAAISSSQMSISVPDTGTGTQASGSTIEDPDLIPPSDGTGTLLIHPGEEIGEPTVPSKPSASSTSSLPAPEDLKPAAPTQTATGGGYLSSPWIRWSSVALAILLTGMSVMLFLRRRRRPGELQAEIAAEAQAIQKQQEQPVPTFGTPKALEVAVSAPETPAEPETPLTPAAGQPEETLEEQAPHDAEGEESTDELPPQPTPTYGLPKQAVPTEPAKPVTPVQQGEQSSVEAAAPVVGQPEKLVAPTASSEPPLEEAPKQDINALLADQEQGEEPSFQSLTEQPPEEPKDPPAQPPSIA